MRDAFRRFGEEAYYGVELVELIPTRSDADRLVFGRMTGPGHIVLYDQPRSPWRLGAVLPARERARLRSAGAVFDVNGVVTWPAGALRRFMLGHVLAHELGHHVLQHERRLRGERAARTRDHEARADAIAARLRALLD